MLVWIPGIIEEKEALDCWQEFMPDAVSYFLEEMFRTEKLPANLIEETLTVYCQLENGQVYKSDYKVIMVPQAIQVSKEFKEV